MKYINKFKYQEPNDIYNNSNRFDINYCNEYDIPKYYLKKYIYIS